MKLAARYLRFLASSSSLRNQSSETNLPRLMISETQTLGLCEVSCLRPGFGISRTARSLSSVGTRSRTAGQSREDIRGHNQDSEGYPLDELRQILGRSRLTTPPNTALLFWTADEISFSGKCRTKITAITGNPGMYRFLLITWNYIRSFRGGSRVAMLDFYEDQRNEFLEKIQCRA